MTAQTKRKSSRCCQAPLARDQWERTTCSKCEQELSACCGAAVTIAYDGVLSCKKCWGGLS